MFQRSTGTLSAIRVTLHKSSQCSFHILKAGGEGGTEFMSNSLICRWRKFQSIQYNVQDLALLALTKFIQIYIEKDMENVQFCGGRNRKPVKVHRQKCEIR